MKTAQANDMAKIAETVYGVNPVQCEPIVLEWAAHKAIELGADAADVAKQWKRINARRYRLGVHAPIPSYSHPCFAAY
jgi:hypothetical protein